MASAKHPGRRPASKSDARIASSAQPSAPPPPTLSPPTTPRSTLSDATTPADMFKGAISGTSAPVETPVEAADLFAGTIAAPGQATPERASHIRQMTGPLRAVVVEKTRDTRTVVMEVGKAGRETGRARFLTAKEHPFVTTLKGIGRVAAAALGAVIIVYPLNEPEIEAAGWQAAGLLLGITLIVFSLFGDLPRWIGWTQKVGAWLTPGVIIGVIGVLYLHWAPINNQEFAWQAWSPRVWGAYLSIILVSVSFEVSSFPSRIFTIVKARFLPPYITVPLYVVIAGLAGNLFDGVTIIAISAIIFFRLLRTEWATRASFALLFGGLISNLITVAAEPTNIKFQDSLFVWLDKVNPSYWLMNWPISVLGILFPAIWLAVWLRRENVSWRDISQTVDSGALEQEDDDGVRIQVDRQPRPGSDIVLSSLALFFLAAGIIAHSILHINGVDPSLPPLLQRGLWIFLLPAGVLAAFHIMSQDRTYETLKRFWRESQIWIRLMAIFALIWILTFALTETTNVFTAFFDWPIQIRYPLMTVLSLLSAVTDNVALAAMQAGLILNHPLPVWAIRFLFILLTWAGGLTAFGCLQSLALHAKRPLSMGAWYREARGWAALTLIGGLIGLVAIILIYPSELSVPR